MSALAEKEGLQGEVDELRSKVAALEAQLAEHSPRVQILDEPLTYDARLVRDRSAPKSFRAVSKRGNYSYVQDLALVESRGDLDARARLERHAQEMQVIGEEREQIFHPDADYAFEQRAVNWASGLGGYFAPPLWIVEWFAGVPTPERVLSELAPKFELPEGVQSVNLPAWSLGAEMGEQMLNAPAVDQDPADTAVSSAVATIAGNFDVPLQMLEQSPQGAHLDWVAFTNMEARYGFQLELQLYTGTGASIPQGSGNNQLLGIFNNTAIPAANQVTYTGSGEGSPTGATAMFNSIGLLPAKVGQNRLVRPECFLMSTSRAAWLGASEDTQSRPLMIANNPSETGKWDLMAYRVELVDALPRNLGAGANEDRILVCRPSDWLILESERKTSINLDVLSGTLQARLQMRRYVAALLRFPSSVAYLLGSGMATGGGF